MAEMLRGSAVWRALLAVRLWLVRCARGSAVFAAIGRCWHASGTRAWFVRHLGADDCQVQGARTTRWFAGVNRTLAGCSWPRRWWEASLLCRVWRAVLRALQRSRILGWLFADGIQSFMLYALGGYVVVDWLLRDVLKIALLASVWDELFLLFGLFWVIWRRTGRQTPVRVGANPLDVPVALFLAVGLVLMSIVAPYPAIQLSGYRATVQYMLWFFLITRLVETDDDFMRVYGMLCAVAALLALHGIYQYIIGVPMPSNWVAAAETAVRTRVYSIFGSPNIMGDFMVLFVPMTVGLAYHTKNRYVQAGAWLAAAVMCVACLFTMSRGAWMAMAVAIVLFILLVDRRLFWLMLAAGCVLVLVPFVRTRIGFLFTDDFVAANSNGGRAGRWENGLAHLYGANPATGFGLGMFGGAVAMQNQVLDGVDYFYMDNYYLKILVEMGWTGLASFVVLLLAMLWNACRALFRTGRKWKQKEKPMYPLCAGMFAGLCGVLVHCYGENIFEEPYMMVYFWVVAGLLIWAGFLRGRGERSAGHAGDAADISL